MGIVLWALDAFVPFILATGELCISVRDSWDLGDSFFLLFFKFISGCTIDRIPIALAAPNRFPLYTHNLSLDLYN